MLEAEGTSDLAKLINKTTDEVVAASLSMSPEEERSITTIDEGIANFIKAYRTATTEFPESSADQTYEFTTKSSTSFRDKNLLSIKLETYSYWGGAHGYSDTKYLNFDIKSAEQLTQDKLFKDKEKFKSLAEQKFRKQQNIAPEANINEPGYFFENDTFSLPNTIGFDQEYVILIYNPYEVAPYAEGQIILEIPLEEAKSLLSIPVKK